MGKKKKKAKKAKDNPVAKTYAEITQQAADKMGKQPKDALYDRARKIGMSAEMIATYPDEDALKKACDGISPQTNPDARPKEGVIPPPKVYDKMPDKFEFDSKLEAKFITQNRASFDENNLKAKLRRINRRYGAQKPVKIVKTVTFKPVKGIDEKTRLSCRFLVTHFEIFMKG